MRAHIFVLAAMWSALAGAVPAPPSVSQLGWLEGAWTSESKGRWTEEVWTAPRGGLILGVNRSGKGDSADNYEYSGSTAIPAG